MLWLYCILFLIFGLLFILLFSPIAIEVDSDADVYRIRYGRIASGALIVYDGVPALKIRILGFPKQWGLDALFLKRKVTADAPKRNARQKSVRKNNRSFSLKKMIALLRAIEFRRFEFDVDTGSYLQNAWLFPVFFMASKGTRRLRINFRGKTIVHIDVRAVPAKLLWVFIKT